MSRAFRQLLEQMTHRLGGDATDGELLDRFCAGRDESAFAALVERHGAAVLSTCRRVLQNHHDAEDAFQATFLALARKAATLDRRGSLGCWLHTVACNMSLKLKAAARRQPTPEATAMHVAADEPRDPVGDREIQALLDAELERLPEKYRAPLVLCYLNGKTNEAAARELGWPVGSIAKRLARARELLRDRMAARLGLSATALGAVLVEPVKATVPSALASATCKAAVALATSKTLASGLVSAHVLALAEHGLRSPWARARIATILLATLATLAGAGIIWHSRNVDDPADGEAAAAAGDAGKAQSPDDPLLRPIQDKLEMPVSLDGFDPNTPLKEALEELSKRTKLAFTLDRDGLKAAGIAEPENIAVKLPKVVDMPLFRVLDLLLRQKSSLRYRVHPDGIAITSARAQIAFRGSVLENDRNELTHIRRIDAYRDKMHTSTQIDGFDANTPVKEALGFISERYALDMWMDIDAFGELGLKEPENIPIVEPRGDMPLFELCRHIIGQVHGPRGEAGTLRLRGAALEIAPATTFPRLVFSADGRRLATTTLTDHDGEPHRIIRTWDASRGRELRSISLGQCNLAGFALTPNGETLVAATQAENSDVDPTIGITRWHAASGKKEKEQEAPVPGQLVLSPDGQWLAVVADQRCRIVYVDGRPPRSIAMDGMQSLALRIGGDGQTIVGLDLAATPNRVFLCNPARDVASTRLRLAREGQKVTAPINLASLSRDGQLLATVDCLGGLDLWEVVSGRHLRRCETAAIVQDVAFSPDGLLIAAITELGRGQTAELFGCSTGERLHRLRGDPDGTWLRSIAFSPDGKLLAACDEDGLPVLWNLPALGIKPPALPRSEDTLDSLWEDLASKKPARARRAVERLAADPDRAVPFLKSRLKPRDESQEAIVTRALRELDDEQFSRRREAEQALLGLGKQIEPRLRAELRSNTSLEMKRSLERILDRLHEPAENPEVLRQQRALQALARIDTPAARKIVQVLVPPTPDVRIRNSPVRFDDKGRPIKLAPTADAVDPDAPEWTSPRRPAERETKDLPRTVKRFSLAKLREEIAGADEKEAYAAAQALSERPNALPLLLELLQGKDSRFRQRAAFALGHMGPDAATAVPALLDALKAEDAAVRRRAAEALAQIRPLPEEAVFTGLLTALKDSDTEVRLRAAETLGNLGTRAVAVLMKALEDPDARVRWGAADALGNIQPRPFRAVPLLRDALHDADAEVRKAAARAIASIEAARDSNPHH